MAVELATGYVSLSVEAKGVTESTKRALKPAEAEAKKTGDRAGKAMSHGISSHMKALVGTFAGTFAAIGVADFIRDSMAAAKEGHRVEALTQQIVKTTGQVAGVTAEQVKGLSEALAEKTGIDRKEIQSGANLILTFRNIRNEAGKGNDIFNQTTQAALDLSKAGFGSVKSASKVLGKALNDPVKGMGALSRVGVTLTEAQKAQVKAFVKSGDVLKAQMLILGQVLGRVGGAAAAVATSGQKVAVQMDKLKEALGDKLLVVTKTVNLEFLKLVEQFKSGEGVGGELAKVWGVLTPILGFMGDHAALLGKAIVSLLVGMLAWKVATIGMNVVSAIQLTLLKANTEGTLHNTIVTKIAAAATKVWAAGTWLLNAAMEANPIGLVVIAIAALVAGIILAYRHSETFRNIVQTVWAAIQSAIGAVVGWLTGTAWPAIQAVISGIGKVISVLYSVYVKPYLAVIRYEFEFLRALIVNAIWPGIKWVFGQFMTFVMWLYTRAVRPSFNAIAGAVNWLYRSVIRPVFTAIGGAATWLYRNAIYPAFSSAKSVISTVSTFISGTVYPKIKSAFDKTGSAIKTVWDKTIHPVFNALKTGVDAVKTGFGKAVDGIKTAWGKLEGYAKAPVKFVIQTVFNNGLIAGMNWISSKIDGPKISPIPLPKGFKTGGVLPGYTPGRDVHSFYSPSGGRLDLSGGEAIMRPEWTRAVGGPKAVEEMNRRARHGFAGGGVVDWLKRKGSGAFDWVSDKTSAIYKAVTNPIDFLKSRVPRMPGSDLISEMAADSRNVLVDAAGRKISALWKALKGGLGKAFGSPAAGPFSHGIDEWKQLWAIVHQLIPGIQLTSAYRPGAITASGNGSYHALGRAIDVAPPSMSAFHKIKSKFPKATELIYSPAGAEQLKDGRSHVYGEPVKSMHYNHIHLAMKNGGIVPKPLLFDQGGVLPVGTSLVHNGTGSPEPLQPAQRGYGDIHVTIAVDELRKLSTVADFLELLERDRINQRRTARSGKVAS